jgi:hypothetical protein
MAAGVTASGAPLIRDTPSCTPSSSAAGVPSMATKSSETDRQTTHTGRDSTPTGTAVRRTGSLRSRRPLRPRPHRQSRNGKWAGTRNGKRDGIEHDGACALVAADVVLMEIAVPLGQRPEQPKRLPAPLLLRSSPASSQISIWIITRTTPIEGWPQRFREPPMKCRPNLGQHPGPPRLSIEAARQARRKHTTHR